MKTHRYSKFNSVKEDVIEDYLVAEVKKAGGRAIKFDPRNGRGLPDRILFFPGGLMILCEVKRPDIKAPRRNQQLQLESFRRLGFEATWCNTKTKVDKIVAYARGWVKENTTINRASTCIRQECPLRRTKG